MRSRPFWGWRIAVASGIGLACSVPTTVAATFSVFLSHVLGEFHWSQSAAFGALLPGVLAGVPLAPVIGGLVDRYGARRVVLLAFLSEALVLASFYLQTDAIWTYYLRYMTLGIVGLGTAHVAFARVISLWFDRHRGQALGIALAGVGIGGVIWPLYVQRMIDLYGWRSAFVILGGTLFAIVAVLVLPLLRDTPASVGQTVDGEQQGEPATAAPGGSASAARAAGPAAGDASAAAAELPGFGFGEAVRSGRYWLVMVTFTLIGLVVQSLLQHMFPMLRARGMSPMLAASGQSLLFIAVTTGRLCTGWLMDRFFAPRVAVSFLLAPICGIALFLSGATDVAALAAALLVGLAVGAEIDVLSYIVSRYFGLRSFSRIYGSFYGVYSMTGGLGPLLVAMTIDRTGNYQFALWLMLGALLLCRACCCCGSRHSRAGSARRARSGATSRGRTGRPGAARSMSREPAVVLSVIPPMTQLNTAYPSTAYLTGFLRSRGIAAVQEDLALGLVLRLLSGPGLHELLAEALRIAPRRRTPALRGFIARHARYLETIGPAIAFLQGRDPTLAHRIATRRFLPEGPRFAPLEAYVAAEPGGDPLAWAFGALGSSDRARHLATLYLNDLADVVREAVDPRFEFVRYAESLAQSQPSFAPLAQALAAAPNLLDRTLQSLALEALERHRPQLVLVSVPFPGSVYGAFRIAQAIRAHDPAIRIALGGGWVNTELRRLAEPRVFDYFDFVTLDAGERPALALVEHLRGERPREHLVRTLVRADGAVRLLDHREPDIPFAECGTPSWDGLPLGDYLSVLDLLNPMHRLWSDGRWNKLTVAQGCYWKKCSFCDTSLDYISRYETAAATVLVDRIERIVAETGQSGFHFVDEAAPPKSLRALAAELQRRGVAISWWGNIRFEKSFNPALCRELAASGCIAVTGGLEVASDRLLRLMKKGVSVAQVARVTRAFSDAGILVHAYLMYGFPTQTAQETVDALEYVRQLFVHGCIQSGFFHRFTCTVHSPVGLDPRAYGVTLAPRPVATFAENDVAFLDPSGVDHDALGRGLARGLYNFMHGIGLDTDVRRWFDGKVPRTSVPRDYVERALAGVG
ncbi:MAG: MFS transporter [Steroidobacteraceae bacterium]